MNNRTTYIGAVATLLAGVFIAGCAAEPPAPAGTDAPETDSFIGRQMAKGIAKAQYTLETENIRVGSHSHIHINGRSYGAGRAADGLPKAEITPDGEFLISGETVPASEEQRERLLAYRGQLIGIAQAGLEVGAQGANIAGTALSGLGGLLLGGEEGRNAYEKRIKAEAETIKQEAVKLCALLPGLYDSQQALAASMPEFAPYATMTRQDIDECGKDIAGDAVADAHPDSAA